MEIIRTLLPGNVRISVPNDISTLTTYVLLEQGDWFEDELKFIRSYIREGMTVLDIGASYGTYTLTLAQRVGSQGGVACFEPNPNVRDCLTESVFTNQYTHVAIYPYAVSDKDGVSRLSMRGSSETATIDSDEQSGIAVETRKITSFPELMQASFDFVKLDAEGEEAKIIKGSSDFFEKQNPLILFEIRHDKVFNESAKIELENLGYSFFKYLPSINALVPIRRIKGLDAYTLNLFACKKAKQLQLERDGFIVHEDTAPRDDALAWSKPGIREMFSRYSYATTLVDTWMKNLDSGDGKLRNEYMTVLSLFDMAQSSGASKQDRLTWLTTAYSIMNEIAKSGVNMGRLMTYARLAHELGYREQCMDLLSTLIKELESRGGQFTIPEPFVPPNARYDFISPGENVGNWIRSSILEQLVNYSGFSSYFLSKESLDIIQNMVELGFMSHDLAIRGILSNLRELNITHLTEELLMTNDFLLKRVIAIDEIATWSQVENEEAAESI